LFRKNAKKRISKMSYSPVAILEHDLSVALAMLEFASIGQT
jgi:hypothetical protein